MGFCFRCQIEINQAERVDAHDALLDKMLAEPSPLLIQDNTVFHCLKCGKGQGGSINPHLDDFPCGYCDYPMVPIPHRPESHLDLSDMD